MSRPLPASSRRSGARVAPASRRPRCSAARSGAAAACRDGEGRPVLLIPGFLAGDGSLATMTHWLRENGYHTRRAGIRANVGCSRRRAPGSRQRLERSRSDTGERVAIIGQSRGGIFARALAVRRPDLVERRSSRSARRPSTSSARTRSCSPRSCSSARSAPRRVPGMFRISCLRGDCCTSFRDDARGRVPARGRLHRDLLQHRRRSSTGAPAWTRRPSSRGPRLALGMGVNAEVYAAVGNALGRSRQRRPAARGSRRSSWMRIRLPAGSRTAQSRTP